MNVKARPVLTEAQVQQAVVQFLELDGWRAIRTDPVSDKSRGKGFGEVGMPDYLFIRYTHAVLPESGHISDTTFRMLGACAQVLWIEFKRKGAKRTGLQVNWHSIERSRGALVMTVDDIDEFTKWYLASGLNRRIQK